MELAVCHQGRLKSDQCFSKVSDRAVEGGLEGAEMRRQTRRISAGDRGSRSDRVRGQESVYGGS